MTKTSKPTTAEELLAMGRAAKWLELWKGELRNVSPANFQYGRLAAEGDTIAGEDVLPGFSAAVSKFFA